MHTTRSKTRRQFLSGSIAALGAAAAAPGIAGAAEPIARTGGPYMKLGLAAYSFNKYFARRGTPDEIAQADMTLEDFIAYCAELKIEGTELTSYYFPNEVTPEYLLALKQRCFRLGLDISGTAIGNDFCLPDGPARDAQLADAKAWIDHAAMMGAPHIRIFAGKTPPGDSDDVAIERCIAGINEALDYAATKGVFLGLENHGGITATPDMMLRIVEGVKPSPWFGVNFDSGNFNTADPYGDLERIAPYTINAQIKVAMKPNGVKERADFNRIIGILKQADYRGYVVLEYEESEPPKDHIPALIEELRTAIEA